MRRFISISMVILGAVIFTTIGIRASDYLTATDAICPADMVPVDGVPGVLCVDRFEASATAACLHSQPTSPQATKGNLALPTCVAVGDGTNEPWRFIAREEAALMCARSGKRLPTAEEWYGIALPTTVTSCHFDATSPAIGNDTDCITPAGVAHMPGNVWEWVSDDVFDTTY